MTSSSSRTLRRPRSAIGSRPSRFSCSLALSARHLVHALGTVYEAPTFSQWVPAFSRSVPLALSTRRPRSASGSRPSRFPDWRWPDCLKARHKRVLNEIKDSALLMLTKDVCSFDAPNKVDRVGVSAHNPGTLAGVTTHAFQNEFLGFKRQQST